VTQCFDRVHPRCLAGREIAEDNADRGGKEKGEDHNARVENEVRNLFNRVMIDIARRYAGYPVKDTGDGGIIVFGHNILTCLEDQGEIEPDERSAINAILCAVAMVNGAEEFVKGNIKYYPDWFKEPKIRELQFEGGSLRSVHNFGTLALRPILGPYGW